MKDLEFLKLFDRNVPQQAEEEVRQLVALRYGVEGTFRRLLSERDQNFHIATVDGTGDGQKFGKELVFKISNVEDDADTVGFQLAALQHITAIDPELPLPRVIADHSGRIIDRVRFSDGKSHMIHMLSYVPGVPMDDTDAAEYRPTRRQIGSLMARLDLALRGFFHPAANQQHPWNMETCLRFLPLTEHIPDKAARQATEGVFARARDIILPRLRTMRHQVIHQDGHSGNILIDVNDRKSVSGLIDFGDMLFGSIAAELAVASDCLSDHGGDVVDEFCDVAAGFDAVLPLEECEIDILFDLVLTRAALTGTLGFARASLMPDEEAHIRFPEKHVELVDRLLTIGQANANRRLRSACRFPAWCPTQPESASDAKSEEALLKDRHRLIGINTTHFYRTPMHFERGAGPFLYSTDGRRYLDCYNNVTQVGHCNPHVVRAISRQAAALNTNTRYMYSTILEYADRLTGKLAPHLDACIFVNSGSEANDVAWQMAKCVSGKRGALIMEDAYHGVTDVIRQFSPGRPDRLLPDFLKGLIVPDPYRGPYRDNAPDLVSRYAADGDRAIAELDASGHGVAAFMIDSALCSSGVPEVPDGYMRAIEQKVRAAGGLMICDEVQSGFGRMGQWWGHEFHGMRADIVTMGKPVGNGHPLGAVVTTRAILNQFIDATHLFSTFGGNTVACAAGNAVLDVIERDDLINNGIDVGKYLRNQLGELALRHELIGDIRGHGMLCGLEFVDDREKRTPATESTARLLELMRQKQVLVGSEGRDANILKLRPCLVFRREHVDLFIDALDASLTELKKEE